MTTKNKQKYSAKEISNTWNVFIAKCVSIILAIGGLILFITSISQENWLIFAISIILSLFSFVMFRVSVNILNDAKYKEVFKNSSYKEFLDAECELVK